MGDVRGWLGPTVAILAASALLGLAGSTGPFFVSSAGTAMLDAELESAGDGPPTLLGIHSSGVIDAGDVRAADERLRAELDDRGLPAAGLQLVIDVATTDGQRINLIGRDRDAMEQLPPVVDDAPGQVAVDAFNAPRLELGAGDRLQVVEAGFDPVTIQVGPVVESFNRQDMPPAWRPVTGLLTPVDDPRIPPPPPALVMATGEALSILDQLGHEVHEDGVVAGPVAQVSWTVELAERPTLEQARALVPRLEAVRSTAADPTTELGSALAAPGWSPPVTAGAQLDAALRRVGGAVSELAVPVRLLTLAGQVLALGGVAAAVVLGGRRRLSRARLWSVRGVAPLLLALQWTALALPPVALGIGAGWWAAWLVTGRLGPGGAADQSVRMTVLGELAVAAVAALALVAVVSLLAVRLQVRDASGPVRVPPVAEAIAVVLAAVALWQADARGGVVTLAADGTLRLDPLAVALPVLLVVAICGIGTRLLGLALRAFGRTPGRSPSWFLASRRLRTFGGATMALTFLTAASFGLLALAATLHSSSEATVNEKAGILLGADAVLGLSRSTVTEPPDPTQLQLPATVVRRAPEATLDDGTLVEVLAIDPVVFADVAYQPQYLGDADVRDLVSRLTDAPADAPRPTIVVGDHHLDDGVVRIADVEVPLAFVGAANVFPGADSQRPTLVIPDGGPLAPDDPAMTVQLSIAVFPELWVGRGDHDDAAFRLELAQVERPSVGSGPGAAAPSDFELADDLRADPGVAPTTWTFIYLRGQAGVVATLALLALLGHHVARQRQQALGTNFATRMGLRRTSRMAAEAIEVVVMVAAALALGIVSGILAARTVATNFDPVPNVALPMVFRLPIAVLSQPVVAATLAVAVTVAVTIRTVDRMDVTGLLRSDG